MNRAQLFLSLGAIAVVVVLFQLPRNVVENDQLQEVTASEEHSLEMPQDILDQLTALRSSVKNEDNLDKKANFAHALARLYLDFGVLDSAIQYAQAIESWKGESSRKAADIYFTAFERSPSSEKGVQYATKAREIISALLENDPEDLFLKNRLAMTLVASKNPMAGISLLREIVAIDENNRQAILNLGLLSVQSGQFNRARDRFEKLVSLDSGDHEAKLYLAVAMMELDQQTQARLLLEEILATPDSIPAIKMMANDYLGAL